MEIQEFQRTAKQTDKIDPASPRSDTAYMLGVLGELGSLLSEVKKSIRDGSQYTGFRSSFVEELGDLSWYVARLASQCDVDLANGDSKTAGEDMDSDETLFQLAETISKLISGIRLHSRDLPALFRNVMQSLKATCSAHGENLEHVLERNVEKRRGVWGGEVRGPAPIRDTEYPHYETLPRNMKIEFIEIPRGESTEVIQRVRGIAIGDRLTDNSFDPDGYRYHDAFHLAYVACLGWSPVVRRMLRAKRKTESKIDEVQDGARAAIIEEGIASLAFNYARDHSWLSTVDRIDNGTLTSIMDMVRGLEVEEASAGEWQHAILTGFEVFRKLRDNRGGWLIVNADKRSLTYSAEEPGA